METLRDLYHRMGLTRAEVARLAGVSDTTLDAMNRKELYVKDATIAKVCNVLGIDRATYDALDICSRADHYRQLSGDTGES